MTMVIKKKLTLHVQFKKSLMFKEVQADELQVHVATLCVCDIILARHEH